jgi:LuxR family maltose regulon positive regulatory protein
MRDVARTTLTPPALPRDLVSRPSLRAVLDTGVGRALTLVCAPPGFGKSLLLADWVARSPQVPTAWVTLDEDHDDPCRMWTAVLAALRGCPVVPPSSRLHRLVVSRTTVELDFVDDLLRALVALPRPLRLVLDDAHHLQDGPVADHLRMLVRAHPQRVQLVLAGRQDPLLPLARLRLDDQLRELRAEQLRFSPAETEALLRRSGLRLAPRQSALLHERTGGWVAGVRLAGRSLAEHPDPDGFLAAFSGDERSVADYLVGEVLAGIPEDQRDVLRRTSIVDPVPAALAVELCDREDAADLLHLVAQDLGLVSYTGPDRIDYHVQELLRSYLLADLHRLGREQVAALHRRAALWWDRRGDPAEALRQAGRAGDPALLADLLGRRAAELMARGEHGVLRGALDAAGSQPGTAVWRAALSAQVHLERGDSAAVAADVRRAWRDGPPEPGSDLAVLLSATQRLAGLDRSPPRAEPLPEDPSLAALVRAGWGAAAVVAGAPAAGRTDLVAALESARRLELPLLEAQCLCLLATAAWMESDLAEAASVSAVVREVVPDRGWDGTGWAAAGRAAAALTALEQGRPVVAREAAETGLWSAGAGITPGIRFALRVARGGALFDTGERAAGLLELQQARTAEGGQALPLPLAVTAALLEHRAALLLGYSRAAAAAAGRLVGVAAARCELLLVRAWTEAASGSFRTAGVTVAPLLGPSARPARPGTVVEAWLVTAMAALQDGDRPRARHALRAALDRARQLDLVRPFALAPVEVRALLVDELVGRDERAAFAARVLAGPSGRRRPAGALLTAREHDVLDRLPSLLNLDEIADDLSVSVNTVKSHVRSIYDKLGAGSRRRAVLAAHEQGLLR